MKTYEEYRVSGVKWLGKVPKHWEICRFKDFISLQTQTSLSENKIGLENIECATGKFIETNSEFEGNGIAFDVGDVIYGKLRPYLKKVWLSTFNGNAVGDFFVFRAKNTNSASYIRYVMLSDGFTKEADGSTFGTKMPRVSSNFIMSMRYFLPPPFEQQAIADYLDAKTEKMDQMIAKAEKKIEYLGELKQSLITRAVTRGLNPNAPLKDSGVKWIGDVPEHWEIAPLKYFTHIKTGSTPPTLNQEYYESEDINWFTPGDFESLTLKKSGKMISNKAKDDYACKIFPAGSVYIVGIGATIGKVASCSESASCNQQINVLIPIKDKIDCRYLVYCMNSQKEGILLSANMVTLPIINQTKMGQLPIPIPLYAEQQQIATYLDIKCSKIDYIIAAQKKKIAYLQELKQSLIANVVTGKIKVS